MSQPLLEAGILAFGESTGAGRLHRRKNALTQGPWIVRRSCEAAGLVVHDLHERWRPVPIVMAGLFWWEHLYDLISTLADAGIEPSRTRRRGKPWIFVGGQLPSYNPGPLRELADLACIGDGEQAAPAALRILAEGGTPRDCLGIPGIYVSEADNRAAWQQAPDILATVRWPFWNATRTEGESGVRVDAEYERRLEIARGCRRKCLFCGVSWTKSYRELPVDVAVEAVRSTEGAVKSFAPDPLRHSGWKAIDDAYRSTGRVNNASDISTTAILEAGNTGRSGSKMTGIDGLSERLRAALAKPLRREQLREVVRLASSAPGALHCYQIVDLPGEQQADYDEWIEDLRDSVVERDRFVLTVGLNTFNPTPHTPLQWEGIRLENDTMAAYWRALEILGPADGRRLQHKMLARPFGAGRRLLEASVLRGVPELWPLYLATAAHRVRLDTVAKVRLAARQLRVLDHLDATVAPRDPSVLAPWETRVETPWPRSTLLAARAHYHRRMGLPL